MAHWLVSIVFSVLKVNQIPRSSDLMRSGCDFSAGDLFGGARGVAQEQQSET